ncbi:MAG: hypothetical protein ABI645_01050 [Pseudomonadota bacterium]
MAIYKLEDRKIAQVTRTTFSALGLQERRDIQAVLKSRIDVVSPNTLIVAEEFGDWEDSKRRIDLLGVDKNANLVVIELKRTEDGGHMELQAIRYASMVSTLTFSSLIPIYENFLAANKIEKDATKSLLEFLEWTEPNEDEFAQDVKIVLASAEFSKELTTSVMWLNDYGLDIRCVRMHPYADNGKAYIDVQQVIPIPEIADYQVRIREKKQKERQARATPHDTKRYDVTVAGKTFLSQPKRRLIFHAVNGVLATGVSPDDVSKLIPWRRILKNFDGELSGQQARDAIMLDDQGGPIPLTKRYFCKDGEPFHWGGRTYVLSNQWGHRTLEAADILKVTYPQAEIEYQATGDSAEDESEDS